MKIKKLNESSLVDKKVSTLVKDGKPMYFTDDQLEDAKEKDTKNQINKSSEMTESATHCVYFTQDGIDQVEFEGTEDECNKYISDIQAEQDDEFGEEAPERFVKRLKESIDTEDITQYRDELQKYIDNEMKRSHVFFVDETFDGRLCVAINWGDWKHEHLACDWLVTDFFANKNKLVNVDVDVTEENGTDAYSAIHYYSLRPQSKIESDGVIELKLLDENIEGQGKYSDIFHNYSRFLMDENNCDSAWYLISQLIRYCKEEDLKDLWLDRMEKVAKSSGFEVDDNNSLKESVDTVPMEGPKEGPEFGLSSLLNQAVQEELKTVDFYNSIAVTARDNGFNDIASMVDEINTEENKHIGQLQEALKSISPNAVAIEDGSEEGQEQLSDMTIVDDDLTDDELGMALFKLR
jgi:hypothetical protein